MTVRIDTPARLSELPDGASIEAVQPLPNDPAMRRVRAAGRTIAVIRDTDVQSLRLEAGMPLDASLRRAIVDVVDLDAARRVALRLLGRRAYSSRAIIERLVKRGHQQGTACRVVDELVADGWIDDAQLARDLIDGQLARGPAGRLKLMQKLSRQHISDDIAEHAVDQALASTDGRSNAIAFVRRELRNRSGVGEATMARRLAGQLARRGVDQETIEDVLREVGILDDHEDTID